MTYLNENRIPAARGGTWSLSSVQRVLTNKQAIGHFQPTRGGQKVDELITDYYTPIIDENTFYAVQDSLKTGYLTEKM